MSVSRFQCPDCHASLKTPEPVPSGKKIRCPKCKSLFTIPGLQEEEDTVLINADGSEEQEFDATEPVLKPQAKKKKIADDEDAPPPPRVKSRPPVDEEDEEASETDVAPKPAKSKRTLLLLCGGGAILAIIALLVVLFLK